MRFYERSSDFRALRIMGKCTSRHLFRYGGLTQHILYIFKTSKLAVIIRSFLAFQYSNVFVSESLVHEPVNQRVSGSGYKH